MGVKVTITTEARPVYNGRPSNVGETIEVSQAEADQIVERGWGEVSSSKKKEQGMKKDTMSKIIRKLPKMRLGSK